MERTKRYQLEKKYMKLVKDILESYEEICIMSVVEPDLGIVELSYPEYQEDDLTMIINDIRSKGISIWEIRGGDNDRR